MTCQLDSSYHHGMTVPLTRQELDTWRGFRFMVEETSLGVSRALSSSTGMSGGEFGILSILAEAPLHTFRQQDLADAMRWDRTRLSHQLTRMEGRGLITRKKGDGGITLVLLAIAGEEELRRAAPRLGQIVKEKFFSRLNQAQLASLEEIRRALETETPLKDLSSDNLKQPARPKVVGARRSAIRSARSEPDRPTSASRSSKH